MSEERVSALEKALRSLAETFRGRAYTSIFEASTMEGKRAGIEYSADMVHARDAQLWALLEEIEEDRKSEDHFAEYPQYMDAATPLRAILEGQTETP